MDLVSVRARDCACPGTPHAAGGDTVSLLPRLSLSGGLAAQADIIAAAGDGSTLAQRWLVTYVTHGAVGWNLVNEVGPIPFDLGDLLADYAFALPVAERADELYSPSVIDPLARRLNETSRAGRTGASTSPRVQSIPRRRARSSPARSAASMPSTG